MPRVILRGRPSPASRACSSPELPEGSAGRSRAERAAAVRPREQEKREGAQDRPDYTRARWTSRRRPSSARSRRSRGSSPRPRSRRTRRSGTATTPSRVEVVAKLGELGLLGVCVPEELGGAGADFLSYILVLEELSRADAGVGVTVAVHTSAVTLPILAFGTEEQRQRFVPELAAGRVLGSFALTEAGLRLRRRRAPHDRDPRRRRLAARRRQAVDHERAATPATFLVFGAYRPLDDRRRGGVSAFLVDGTRRRGDARGGEARPQLVVDRRHPPRRRPRRRGPAPARGEPRLQGRDGRRSTAAASGSPRRRSGSRRRRYDAARDVRARAARQFGSRIADVPGDPVQARRHGDRDRGRARTHVPRARWLKQNGAAAHPRGRAGEALRVRPSRGGRRRGDPGARRLRLHEGVPGRALLPRREGDARSTRARARSSGS